jgi:photosystem II stability/assembly factor-like uncharacterized protein
LSVRGIQYLGGGVGVAYSFDPHTKQGYLIGTRDSGRHWSKSALPAGFSGDRMSFVGSRQGLLAGCMNHQLVVARTSDAGRHWGTAQIALPPSDAPVSEGCDFSADDLSLGDAQHGWLLVGKHSFRVGAERSAIVVAGTSDGGVTWTTGFQDAFPVTEKAYSGVQFVNTQLGFMSTRQSSNGHATRASLLYTQDGGRSWLRVELPRPIARCHPYSGALMCAAPDFWVLRIDQRPKNARTPSGSSPMARRGVKIATPQ